MLTPARSTPAQLSIVRGDPVRQRRRWTSTRPSTTAASRSARSARDRRHRDRERTPRRPPDADQRRHRHAAQHGAAAVRRPASCSWACRRLARRRLGRGEHAGRHHRDAEQLRPDAAVTCSVARRRRAACSTSTRSWARSPSLPRRTSRPRLDTGADNVYDVIVHVTDGVLTASQAIAVTVTNADDAAAGTVTIANWATTASTAVADGREHRGRRGVPR